MRCHCTGLRCHFLALSVSQKGRRKSFSATLFWILDFFLSETKNIFFFQNVFAKIFGLWDVLGGYHVISVVTFFALSLISVVIVPVCVVTFLRCQCRRKVAESGFLRHFLDFWIFFCSRPKIFFFFQNVFAKIFGLWEVKWKVCVVTY